MNANAETPTRPIDRWFASYSGDHRNAANQRIHVFAVPAILWSVVALLWCVPVPGGLFRQGLWAALAMFLAWMFYYRASRRLGLGMLAVFAAMAWGTQFVGHRIEGRKPSFLTDLTYLLIGPAWVLAKLYRKLGWRW
jgi:uncharacterized membrane protein YGL010W